MDNNYRLSINIDFKCLDDIKARENTKEILAKLELYVLEEFNAKLRQIHENKEPRSVTI